MLDNTKCLAGARARVIIGTKATAGVRAELELELEPELKLGPEP
jgi:hypothetical protein